MAPRMAAARHVLPPRMIEHSPIIQAMLRQSHDDRLRLVVKITGNACNFYRETLVTSLQASISATVRTITVHA